MACQTSKMFRHTCTPPQPFPMPTSHFHTVHIDVVGPLILSRGCQYLLTCIDRFTRWGEAIPIPDMRAETTAYHFLAGWVAHFGAPRVIITDQGTQFESGAWSVLLKFLGSDYTIPPSVERDDRTLPSPLKGSDPFTTTSQQVGRTLFQLFSSPCALLLRTSTILLLSWCMERISGYLGNMHQR